jgi:hypothetical protein
MPCYAIESHFYLDPHGNVYPCNARGENMGNLLESTYDEIVAKNAALLADVQACNDCWMSCTVTPGLRQRPWTPIAGAARRVVASAPANSKPLGTGQHTIPIYLDARGRQRYAQLKEETDKPRKSKKSPAVKEASAS